MSQLNLDEFQIVVLRSFYDTFDSAKAQEAFSGMAALKLKGYLAEYPYGALPVDTTDFVATHFVLCRKRKISRAPFEPIMAHKWVSSQRCSAHNLHFPAVTILGTGYPDLRESIEGILEHNQRSGRQVHYGSSWTIDPMIRRTNRPLALELRSLFIAANVFYFDENPGDLFMVCGVKKFKTDKIFTSLGYDSIALKSKKEPSFNHAFVAKEEMVVMTSSKASVDARSAALRFKALWDARIEIANDLASARRAA